MQSYFQDCASKIRFNIITSLYLGLRSVLFCFDFPVNTVHLFIISPVCSTCPAHVMKIARAMGGSGAGMTAGLKDDILFRVHHKVLDLLAK